MLFPVSSDPQAHAASSNLVQFHPLLECLLFVAAAPVPPTSIADTLEVDEATAVAALEHFRHHYVMGGGLQVVRVAGGYQLRTRPEYAAVVARFLRPPAQKLSRQALETLAIVAYRQPITVPEIEALRGVASGGVVRTLADRELVREAGRKDAPGRPILYRTTDAFLSYLGLSDLSQLPQLEENSDSASPPADLTV